MEKLKYYRCIDSHRSAGLLEVGKIYRGYSKNVCGVNGIVIPYIIQHGGLPFYHRRFKEVNKVLNANIIVL